MLILWFWCLRRSFGASLIHDEEASSRAFCRSDFHGGRAKRDQGEKGMRRFVSSRSLAVLLAALILLSTGAFYVVSLRSSPNHSDDERKSAEKERTEGASAPSLGSRTPTGEGSDQWDIFLNFRGSDTRNNFTDHLYQRLKNAREKKLKVFLADKSNQIGKEFPSQIFNALAQSKISIAIISKNYPSSKWCLLELIRMIDYSKKTSHEVLPIFYKVTASDVRDLKGSFGEAFYLQKQHFSEKLFQEAQQALVEVSFLQGRESENIFDGHEGELVEEIIKTVLSKLLHQLDEHLVGISGHVNTIKNWVNTPASDARVIGIRGVEGIGKTTLATERCLPGDTEILCVDKFLSPSSKKLAWHQELGKLEYMFGYALLVTVLNLGGIIYYKLLEVISYRTPDADSEF